MKAEDQFQIAVAGMLDLLAKPWKFSWFHVPNETGTRLPVQVMVKRKAMGVKNGVADCIIIKENGQCFEIELKAPKGRQSKAQKEWERACVILDIPYYLCKNMDEVISAMEKEFNKKL